MINSFGDKETESIFNDIPVREFRSIHDMALRKLQGIDSAKDIKDLKVPPGNKLKKLEGNLKAYHSIRINDQYRIIFKWKDNKAEEVTVTNHP